MLLTVDSCASSKPVNDIISIFKFRQKERKKKIVLKWKTFGQNPTQKRTLLNVNVAVNKDERSVSSIHEFGHGRNIC